MSARQWRRDSDDRSRAGDGCALESAAGSAGRSGAPGVSRPAGPGRNVAKRTIRPGDSFAVTQEIDGGSLPIQQWRVVELDRNHIVIESSDGSVIKLIS